MHLIVLFILLFYAFLKKKKLQQGSEIVDSSSIDSNFSEAEGGVEGSLQEEEAFTS